MPKKTTHGGARRGAGRSPMLKLRNRQRVTVAIAERVSRTVDIVVEGVAQKAEVSTSRADPDVARIALEDGRVLVIRV